MQKNRVLKRILGFTQIFVLFLFLTPFFVNLQAASNVGLGEIGYVEEYEIADGVTFERIMAYNNMGEQKAHLIEFHHSTLTPMVTYGNGVYGGTTLSNYINIAESGGAKVIAALNGDFYDTSNGVPLGMMIINGKLVTSGNGRHAVGIKADGSVIGGQVNIGLVFNNGSTNTTINHLNKDRKTNTSNVYMYTDDFGASTQTTVPGTEVVLNITSGNHLTIGGTITAQVEEVRTNATNTSIPYGRVVLGVHNDNAQKLAGLTVGTTITISATDNTTLGWESVIQSIGIGNIIAEDGVITSVAISNKDVHPRSFLGFKDDGTYMLFQVDGRQPGYSNGMDYQQIYDYLVTERGASNVYELDGGGSSTISARLPGSANASVLNNPSDGRERSNANAILFLAKTGPDPSGTVAHLHSYPRNLVILENAEIDLQVKATDMNYYPATLPSNIEFSTTGDIGTIDADGRFVAKEGAGSGTIVIKSGSITETVTVTVLDAIDRMTTDQTFISIAPSAKTTLKVSAYLNRVPIYISNESFTWTVSEGLGSISSAGEFTGTDGSAVGTITISYKGFSLEVPVEVGRLPQMITTFEDMIMRPSANYNWDWMIENPANGGTGNVSINTDERYVKFGHQSLRIDYDFRNATGTTSVTAFKRAGGNGSPPSTTAQYTALEGYPTHIGMWVYGDLNGANIRMQMRDANNAVQYINFVPDTVNWEGWQYIEAEIPTGLPAPLFLQYPIRVMSVAGRVKSSGTLYFDNLRAVYGFRNDDVLSPLSGDITPADGTTITNPSQTVSIRMWDDRSGNYTGVNKDSIKMWINDELIENLLLLDNEDGSVTANFTPSVFDTFRAGPQIVKVRFEDNYGNISFRTWQFLMEGEYVSVDAEISPKQEKLYAGDSFTYTITANQYEDFARFKGSIIYNHRALQIVEVEILDANINVIQNIFNNTTGVYEFDLSGMAGLANQANPDLIRLTFQTRDNFTPNSDSALIATEARVFETGDSVGRKFLLPSYEVKVDYKYRLSYPTSTVGRDISFLIQDANLNPIAGASVIIEGADISITALSDANGRITTSAFNALPVGTTFYAYATLEGYSSQKMAMEILPSLGSSTPQLVIVAPGNRSHREAFITWQTNLDTTIGVVRFRVKGTTNWTNATDHSSHIIQVLNNNNMQEYRAHRVALINLSSNTEYEYQVGNGSVWSPIQTFKTSPFNQDTSMLFIADPQATGAAGYDGMAALINAALTKNPDISLTLLGGDVVEDTNMYAHWQGLNSRLAEQLAKMRFSSASGNHDVIRDYGDPFNWAFTGPNNGTGATLGANYSFIVGNAIVAVIDTETPSSFPAQKEWLINTMNASDRTFKIVLMHRSVYPAFNQDLHIRDWYETMDAANVDLVLSGHDHLYARTAMAANEKVAVGDGPVYVIGGSAGNKFYASTNLENRPWIDVLYEEQNNVYSLIDIVGDELIFTAYALIGGASIEIDSFIISKAEVEEPVATSIEISGASTLELGEDTTLTAIIKDQNQNPMDLTVTWALASPVTGVSISANGVISATMQAAKDTVVTVVATYGDITQTHQITLSYTFVYENTVEGVLTEILNKQKDMIANILG